MVAHNGDAAYVRTSRSVAAVPVPPPLPPPRVASLEPSREASTPLLAAAHTHTARGSSGRKRWPAAGTAAAAPGAACGATLSRSSPACSSSCRARAACPNACSSAAAGSAACTAAASTCKAGAEGSRQAGTLMSRAAVVQGPPPYNGTGRGSMAPLRPVDGPLLQGSTTPRGPPTHMQQQADAAAPDTDGATLCQRRVQRQKHACTIVKAGGGAACVGAGTTAAAGQLPPTNTWPSR